MSTLFQRQHFYSFFYYYILWQIMGNECCVILYRFLSQRIKVFFSPKTWLFGKVVLGIVGGAREGLP